MLVGRSQELAALDQLVADLLADGGRALLLHGDAGIGKTTLLEALVERCGDDVVVLRARGVETEAELAFSALADLLTPLAGGLSELPAPQSAALAAALALGPPAPGDRMAVCVATLGLLRAAATARPLMVVVDDLQWLDDASLECVLYAARRAGGRLALALAARDPWEPLERSGLPGLRLAPFDGAVALELLRRAAPDLSAPLAQAVGEAAAGNPLALVELPATLTPAQRAGVAAIELPFAPGSRLANAFAQRIDELGAPARRALLAAAAHAGEDMTTIAAACPDAARLAEAEERGLVRLTAGHVRFAHPLVRGAAYHAARPADRRGAHTALAGVLTGERRVWHLAAAAVEPDEPLAAELEALAGEAASRRGFAAASAALERAARLTPDPAAVAERLLAAGRAAGAAGAPQRALALLEEAAGVSPDWHVRARADHLRGRFMVWCGRPGEAATLLLAAAERVAGEDRILAAAMLADAANGASNTSEYAWAEELAQRAAALLQAGDDPSARAPVLAILGWMLILRGKAPQARPLLAEARRLAREFDELGPHWPWLHILLRARITLEELECARAESEDLCGRAADAGALATLSGGLLIAADAAFRLGDWDAADDASREAVRVAADTGQAAWLGFAVSTRARLTAARGLEAESREAIATARGISESEGISAGLRFVQGTLGFLELGLDRPDEAIAALEPLEPILEEAGLEEPTLVPWAPDLVEAYVRAGRPADAQRVLATLDRQAASTQTAFAGAAAARCHGMLADDFEPAFATALALHDRRPMPFERARTVLALGRRLHRARRRVEARERLHEALAEFERLGAGAWAAQAQCELRAAGGRRRRSGDGSLTPQEERVAAAVRRGASNREIADGAVPRAEDDRVPPAPDLPQARRRLPQPARGDAGATGARRAGRRPR